MDFSEFIAADGAVFLLPECWGVWITLLRVSSLRYFYRSSFSWDVRAWAPAATLIVFWPVLFYNWRLRVLAFRLLHF